MTTHAAVQRIYIDRSRIESYQRCPRKRWLEYHQDGVGVTGAKKNIALAVGGAVHRGLEVLLRGGQAWLEGNGNGRLEEDAVSAALADFAEDSGALELDTNEVAAMGTTVDAAQQKSDMMAQALELGMSTEGLGIDREASLSKFDAMLYEEQSALVEALVRAYARHRLRGLLEQFEVLEIEREGEWKLAEWEVPLTMKHDPKDITQAWLEPSKKYELVFMSRLDALLRERQTNALYLQSYKTTGTWGDVRRLKAAEHDSQGLTEGIEVEQRLAEWWSWQHSIDAATAARLQREAKVSDAMINFLGSLPEPPRIYAVRYEYLLKGERWEDKELSQQLGITVRTQRSHLIRQYVAKSIPQKGTAGYAIGDVCWSWDYIRTEDDKDSKLAWQNWTSKRVPNVKEWIDQLAATEVLMSSEDSTVGMEPRPLGWKSDAQKLGVTREHPFDAVFPPPVIVFRNDDELRDLVEQFEAQEVRVARDVDAVRQLGEGLSEHPDDVVANIGDLRSILNQKFPQHRHSCFYPTECWATKICYATDAAVQLDPLGAGGGKFIRRVPNHPQEKT